MSKYFSSDLNLSVRLPIIVKTEKAELGHKHRFQNHHETIVHGLPLFYKDVIISGVSIILIEYLGHFYNFFEGKKF